MSNLWARLNPDGTPAEIRTGQRPEGDGWIAGPLGRNLSQVSRMMHGEHGWQDQPSEMVQARVKAFARSPEDMLVEASDRAKEARRRAFAAEADPLFFKVQRGEASEDEYLAKVAEIRARYPYPSEVKE